MRCVTGWPLLFNTTPQQGDPEGCSPTSWLGMPVFKWVSIVTCPWRGASYSRPVDGSVHVQPTVAVGQETQEGKQKAEQGAARVRPYMAMCYIRSSEPLLLTIPELFVPSLPNARVFSFSKFCDVPSRCQIYFLIPLSFFLLKIASLFFLLCEQKQVGKE